MSVLISKHEFWQAYLCSAAHLFPARQVIQHKLAKDNMQVTQSTQIVLTSSQVHSSRMQDQSLAEKGMRVRNKGQSGSR